MRQALLTGDVVPRRSILRVILGCTSVLVFAGLVSVSQRRSVALEEKTPIGFWERPIKGAQSSLNLGTKRFWGSYPVSEDPWLKAGKGSYNLWAEDYLSRHGDSKLYATGEGNHGLASKEDEPDENNQKNGWQQYVFDKWVKKQGSAPSEAFLEEGFPTTGSEYILALKRLGINSFDDLKAFDTEEDMPGYDCDDSLEPDGEKSAHHMCGQLKDMVSEEEDKVDASGLPLWWADNRANITAAGIHTRMARVTSKANEWKRLLSGSRPFDDDHFFCYSRYQEEPEYSQCMQTLRSNTDKKSGQRIWKGKTWKTLTKGLWGDEDGTASVDEGDSFMGQSWHQLTSDLWDKQPYKERNGLEY